MPLDDWSDDPPQGPWPKWFNGCAIPLIIALYATSVLVSGEGTLPGRRGRLLLHGADAIIYGGLLIGLAFFLHAHFFWGNTNALAPYSSPAKVVGLLVFVGGLAAIVLRIVVLQ